MAPTSAIQAVKEEVTGEEPPRSRVSAKVSPPGRAASTGLGHRGRTVLTALADGILPFDSVQPSPRCGPAGEPSGTPYLETVRQNSTAHTAATIAAMTHSVEPITPAIERISPTTATSAAPPPTWTRR